MPTTPLQALPYPSASDAVNVPSDIQALATALDSKIKAAEDDNSVIAYQVFS